MPKRPPLGQTFSHRIDWRRAIGLLLVGAVAYVVVAGYGSLRLGTRSLAGARPEMIGLAFLSVAISYAWAASAYYFLAVRRLAFGPTLLVQIAGGLVNRLLPGGLGGLGLSALYLKKHGHTLATATAIVASNNLLGLVGNGLLLLAMLPRLHVHPSLPMPTHLSTGVGTVVPLAVIGGVLVLRFNRHAARFAGRGLHDIYGYVLTLAKRPFKTAAALGSECCLTTCHATALWIILAALHAHVSWPVALVAVSTGSVTGAAVPTPGGIGGAEAGIAAALTAFGVPFGLALAASLIYRLLTYWLPLLPGYVALRIVEKRYI